LSRKTNDSNIKELIKSFTAPHVTNNEFLGEHQFGRSRKRWEYEINIFIKGDTVLLSGTHLVPTNVFFLLIS
jgi:hypothetical protein